MITKNALYEDIDWEKEHDKLQQRFEEQWTQNFLIKNKNIELEDKILELKEEITELKNQLELMGFQEDDLK